MTNIRIFTAEFQMERKAVVKGFTQKGDAVKWAQERIADESIASIALWQLETDQGAKDALAVAAEGKPWYTIRSCFMVVTRHTVRRVK